MHTRFTCPHLRPLRSVVLLVTLLVTTLATPIGQTSALAYKDPTGDDVVAHLAGAPAPMAMLKAPPTT